MKKRHLKNLSLNKKSISNLAIKGGLPGYTWFCPREPLTEAFDCRVHQPHTSRDTNGALPSECESTPL
ncbi:hypothetical protein [Kordia sp.]|uniref:hypothetical protein n=1 Tax=Kordia sp. TaxID=1965332 RepID=UPI003D278AB7